MGQQQQAFMEHSAWVASLRAEYERLQSSSLPQPPAAWNFPAHPAEPPPLHEVFNEALDLEDFEGPVYRSMGAVAWQPCDEELDFERPVYRSLGGLAGADEAGNAELASSRDDALAAWEQSMPPLVQRQHAFRHL